MIEALIFDVGGVIVRSGDRETRRKWEKRLGLTDWASEDIVFNSEMGTKAQLGEISEEDLWTWVSGQLDLSAREFSSFREEFWIDNRVDRGLVQLIRNLRPGYKTAIISNATDTMRVDLTERYQIADAFDLIVISAEEKIMKPDPEIYQRAIDRLELKPEECIFVDDMMVNVIAARKLAMKAIHFTPEMNLAAELKRCGVTKGVRK